MGLVIQIFLHEEIPTRHALSNKLEAHQVNRNMEGLLGYLDT